MNDTTSEIADALAGHTHFDLEYYGLFLLLVVVGTYVASFLREYAKKRGSQLATKADLEKIQEQLRTSTEIVESVKRDIEHGAWRTRELELLKREKLEQYLLNYYQDVENLTKQVRKAFFYDKSEFDDSAHARISMIQNLYLPEITEQHAAYLIVVAEFLEWLAEGKRELLSKLREGIEFPAISDEHMEKYPELLGKLNGSTLDIQAKAQQIGRSINVA